jgi:hypothetical protein
MKHLPLPDLIIANLLNKSFGIDKYSLIVKELNKRDISKDRQYQQTFNSFYVVRRNSVWRTIYYEYFESQKHNQQLSFEVVLRTIYNSTGRVEPSFSSKLLATVNPDMPIWDAYVLKNLGLKTKLGKSEERMKAAIKIYPIIHQKFSEIKNSEWGRMALAKFNELFPESAWISDTKKLDFFIWQSR